MAYPYVYLSLIPTIIAIAFLIFNTDVQKKYNTKKAGINLFAYIIIMVLDFSWHIISNCYIFPKSGISQYPWWFFLIVFGAGILAPIVILSRQKINRKETIFDKMWFRILLAMIIVIVFFLITFFVMK